MAYTGKTGRMIAEEFQKKSQQTQETHSGNSLEARLKGSGERKENVGYTLEPSVRRKIVELAKKHGYNSASAFVNDVFKQWD